MTKKLLLIVMPLFVSFFVPSCSFDAMKHLDWEKSVGAYTEPRTDSVYYVNDFGAIGDGVTINTAFIQKAIDECAKKGGGIVKFTPGIYVSGSIFVKSGVNLSITKGSMIWASSDLEDYPAIDSSMPGVQWPAAIINIIDQENVAISGHGSILGKDGVSELEGVIVKNSKNVTLKDFSLLQTGNWSLQIINSQSVTTDKLTISNKMAERVVNGICINSSSDILIQGCNINCSGDNLCVKAGSDKDTLNVIRPTERIIIRTCTVRNGEGLLNFTSEKSGSMHKIVAYNIKGTSTENGIVFKSALKKGGGRVEDIFIHNIDLVGVSNPIVVEIIDDELLTNAGVSPKDANYAIPKFTNIHLEEIISTGSKVCIKVDGKQQSTIDNFTLKNVQIEAEKSGYVKFAKDWSLQNSTFIAKNGEKVAVENSVNVKF